MRRLARARIVFPRFGRSRRSWLFSNILQELEVAVQFIMGNGDREVFAQMAGIETEWYRSSPESRREPVRWTAKQLWAEDERLIAGWPATICLMVRGLGEVLSATPNCPQIALRDLGTSHRACGGIIS
jgi:hypothetical protein